MDDLTEDQLETGLRKIEESVSGLMMQCNSLFLPTSHAILHNSNISDFDRLLVSALARSNYLSKAFHDLIVGCNYMASLHIIRLNLDNALRIYAGFLSSDINCFAEQFIDGKPVKDMRDVDGKRMCDGYLAEKLSERYNWVKPLYENTSSFIHFSDKHYEHIFKSDGSGYLGDNDNSKIGVEERLDAISDMKKINKMLYEIIGQGLSL